MIDYSENPISEPGIYPHVPMSAYHEQLTIGPSISSSGLRTIESKSPKKYYAYSYLNPHRHEMSSDALNFGKIAHAMVIGDDHFEEEFALAPFSDFARNEMVEGIGEWKAKTPKAYEGGDPLPEGVLGYKDLWKAEQERLGKTIITQKDFATASEMAAEILAHPFIQNGLLDGESEQTIVWQDEETGVWCKARPDVIPHDLWYPDYKTIENIAAYKRHYAILDYGMHQQFAFVAEGLRAVGRPVPTNFVVVFQEKSPPYEVICEEVSVELVARGMQLNRRALRTFAECVEKDYWPGVFEPTGPYLGPDDYHKRLDQEERHGALPKLQEWARKWAEENPA